MATYKRTNGDFTITGLSGSDTLTLDYGDVTLTGNLTVSGSSTTIDTTNLAVSDNVIVLNDGETGAGITNTTAGINIDRGTSPDVGLRYDESVSAWQATNDGTTWEYILSSGSGGSGLTAVVDDTTPQLGGHLDVNGSNITSVTNNNVVIAPNGTGTLRVDAEVELEIQASDPGGNAGYQHIYGKAVSTGGSGVFFQNPDGTVDELVSKTKAMVFGLIF